MINPKITCSNCTHIRENNEEGLKICPSELYLCQKDGCTKTCGDVHAIRECSWYKYAENKPNFLCDPPSGELVQCQRCKKLQKISYFRAYPTHHENWIRTCNGSTCQYEDTVALRSGCAYERGKPRDTTKGGW